jgi:hypothetical protein
MEEYGVKITYIKGSKKNIVADVLSRYPTTNNPEVEKPIPTQSELSEVFASTITTFQRMPFLCHFKS